MATRKAKHLRITVPRIAINSIWLTMGDVGRRCLVILTTAILGRALGAAGFGEYALAQTYATVLMPILDFGLSPFMIREMARQPQRMEWFLARFMALRIAISLPYFATVVVSSALLGYSEALRMLILLQAAWVIVNGLSIPYRNAFYAVERMSFETFYNIFWGVLKFLLVIAVVYFAMGIMWIGASDMLAAMIGLLVTIAYFNREFFKFGMQFDWSVFRQWLWPLVSLALLTVANEAIVRLGSLILFWFHGSSAVGIYEASLRLVFVFHVFAYYLTQASYPRISQYGGANRTAFSSLTGDLAKIAIGVCLVASTLVTILAQPLIQLLYGNGFETSDTILKVIIWETVPFSVSCVLMYVSLAQGMQAVLLRLVLTSLAIYVLLSVPLIAVLGALGAAIGTCVGVGVWAALLLWFCTTRGLVRLEDLKPSKRDWDRATKSISGILAPVADLETER